MTDHHDPILSPLLEAAAAGVGRQPLVATVRRADRRPIFNRSDLRDAAFYAEHRADILEAARDGRIVDDLPGWQTQPRKTRSAQGGPK